jgi:hypothetical protein
VYYKKTNEKMDRGAANRNTRQPNKLEDGPCAKPFELLEACAIRKGITRSNEKHRMQACPSETDVLIKCINKNPLFFQG